MSTTEAANVSEASIEAVKKLFQKSVHPSVKVIPVHEEWPVGHVNPNPAYYLAELRFQAKSGTHQSSKGIQRALRGTVAIGETPDEAVQNLIPAVKRGLKKWDNRRRFF